jgi:hypothetical protein
MAVDSIRLLTVLMELLIPTGYRMEPASHCAIRTAIIRRSWKLESPGRSNHRRRYRRWSSRERVSLSGHGLPMGENLPGMLVRSGGSLSGIVVYSLDSHQYEKLTDFGLQPVWLNDSRRLLFQQQSKLYMIDSQSKKIHEVLSVAPHEFGVGVALPRDDRLIYFSLLTTDADVWLMTLNE